MHQNLDDHPPGNTPDRWGFRTTEKSSVVRLLTKKSAGKQPGQSEKIPLRSRWLKCEPGSRLAVLALACGEVAFGDAGSVHFVKQTSRTLPDASSIRQLHPAKFPARSGSSFVTPV